MPLQWTETILLPNRQREKDSGSSANYLRNSAQTTAHFSCYYYLCNYCFHKKIAMLGKYCFEKSINTSVKRSKISRTESLLIAVRNFLCQYCLHRKRVTIDRFLFFSFRRRRLTFQFATYGSICI